MKGLINTPLILLLAVTALQWGLISYLLHERHSSQPSESPVSSNECQPTTTLPTEEFAGVAVAVFMGAPAWFHRRFPVLIQNVLANVPSDWAVQLVVHPSFWHQQFLPWHPGMPRLLHQNRERLFVTELPDRFHKLKQATQRLLLDEWFWNQLKADSVLLFSGNGILCTHGNTAENWNAMAQLDYVGAPWDKFQQSGGDGATHSFRNRRVMLQALKHARERQIVPDLPEDYFFVRTLLSLKEAGQDVRLANRNETIRFAGVQTTDSPIQGHLRPIPPPPMVVSGIQAHLTFVQREDLLLVCPELKIIFPSLHEPACFGAHPNPTVCKASICALKNPPSASGC